MTWHSHKLVLAKPLTFMNDSGSVLGALLRRYSVDSARELLLVYDDLDIALGAVRLRKKGSAGTHNGMASVISALGTGDFARIRLGIGPKPSGKDAADFVLSKFNPSEFSVVEKMLTRAVSLLEIILTQGMELALSKHNE